MSLCLDAPGGAGRSRAPRKNASLTYLAKQVDAQEPARLRILLGIVRTA